MSGRRLLGLAAAVWALCAGPALAEDWTVTPVDPASLPASIVPETGQPARNGLPDGQVARARGDILAAWYADPTTRYRHAILGDGIEAGALVVRTDRGEAQMLVLPASEVFEDRTPRLVDLDGDGRIEVVTIRASTTLGAAIAVYGLVDGALVERAVSTPIGMANRWLNVAGIDDFMGLGRRQIAIVRTPHIGGTLIFLDFVGDDLVPVADRYGFSNHEIGAIEQRLSAVADVNGDGRPDLAVPSDRRDALLIMGFDNDRLVERAAIALPARIDKAIKVEGTGESVRFTVGLSDGSVFEVHR